MSSYYDDPELGDEYRRRDEMAITDAIRELVLDQGSHDELRKLCRAEGMRTLQEESIDLVAAGITTPAEVMRSIYVVEV
jgi:type IV pilus assembly protein PilB